MNVNGSDDSPVVGVCGKEARIYGAKLASGIRPLRFVKVFATHGHAKLYAQEYENPSEILLPTSKRGMSAVAETQESAND